MQENWEDCFTMVLQHEGGYVDDPRDPGGMTNLGVTKRAWEAWVGYTVNEEFMRKLTPEKVKLFYKTMYWDKIKGDPAKIKDSRSSRHVKQNHEQNAKCRQYVTKTPPKP